jgi:hypothetical protein
MCSVKYLRGHSSNWKWKAKRESVGDNTTCVQTQTADIKPSTDETMQTDQHNSDAQAISTTNSIDK